MFELSTHFIFAVIGGRGLTLDTVNKNVKELGFEDPAEDKDPWRGFLNANEVLDSIKRGDSTPWNSIQAAPLSFQTDVLCALNSSYP